MKEFKVEKHFRLEPKLFGLDLSVFKVFAIVVVISLFLMFILYLFNFNGLYLLIAFAFIFFLTKFYCGKMKKKSVDNLYADFFISKIKIIKNNSIKPFKFDDIQH